jgi:cysteine-rich repeat protein
VLGPNGRIYFVPVNADNIGALTVCTGASTCATVCGDGKRAGAEGCDDGNLMSGDGCSATCTVEDGFHCVGCTPTTQDICNRVNYARACGAGIQRCWIRMPTGCGQTLTETQTPTVWFLDPYGPDPASCARRVADFNGYCYKSDGQHEWRTDSPACPASQSSTDAYLNAIAERANDGYDGEGVFSGGSCTHTSPATSEIALRQWWRVDMQQSVLVTALKIQGRTDCCPERTQGYSIFVGDKEPAYLEQNLACVTGQPQLPTAGAHSITCTSPVRGRYVYFTIPSGQTLTLCEVSVFGSTCT